MLQCTSTQVLEFLGETPFENGLCVEKLIPLGSRAREGEILYGS